MSMKEELKKEREQYWKEVVESSINSIKSWIKTYQKESQYAEGILRISLNAKYLSGEIAIILFGNYEISLENKCLIVLKTEEALEYYLKSLVIALEKEEVETEEVNEVIDMNEIKKKEGQLIYEGEINLS